MLVMERATAQYWKYDGKWLVSFVTASHSPHCSHSKRWIIKTRLKRRQKLPGNSYIELTFFCLLGKKKFPRSCSQKIEFAGVGNFIFSYVWWEAKSCWEWTGDQNKDLNERTERYRFGRSIVSPSLSRPCELQIFGWNKNLRINQMSLPDIRPHLWLEASQHKLSDCKMTNWELRSAEWSLVAGCHLNVLICDQQITDYFVSGPEQTLTITNRDNSHSLGKPSK